MDDKAFEKLTTEELAMWLEKKGFSVDVQEAFEGDQINPRTITCRYYVMPKFTEQEMDGEATVAAFATCPGPDCLKEVVPKYGPRLHSNTISMQSYTLPNF